MIYHDLWLEMHRNLAKSSGIRVFSCVSGPLRLRPRFDEAHSCLEQLKEEDARLDSEALAVKSEYGAQLNEQMEELRRLEEEKAI